MSSASSTALPDINEDKSKEDATVTLSENKEEIGEGKNRLLPSGVVVPKPLKSSTGSIVGSRSQSGSMIELTASGSFEDSATTNSLYYSTTSRSSTINDQQKRRGRANTEPTSTTSVQAQSVDNNTITVNVTNKATVPLDSNLSQHSTQAVPSSAAAAAVVGDSLGEEFLKQETVLPPREEETEKVNFATVAAEEDEELQRAMAMALAIQKHPHLTPAEIHVMMGQAPPTAATTTTTTTSHNSKQTTTATTSTSSSNKPNILAGRLTNLFQSAVHSTIDGIHSATPSVPTVASNSNTGFSNLRERVAGRRFSITTNNSNSNNNTGTTAARKSPSLVTTTAAVNLPTVAQTDSTTLQAEITTLHSTSFIPTRHEPPTGERIVLDPPPFGAVTSIFDLLNKPIDSSFPIEGSSLQPSVAIPSSLQADTAIFDEPVTPTTTVTLSAFSSRLTPRQSSLSGLFSKTGNSQKNILSQSLSTETTKPILKGVAWKRRGGMGKYSTTAWERRGISLEGTKLHYFRQEDVRAADNAQIDEDEAVLEDGLPSSGGNNKEQRGVVGGPNSWFETAGLNWSSSTSVESAEGSVIPRGTIDLAKDSATVHAAFGHSGAPSPFALSIKIRGETKWKLCFDRHSTQMQWLSAISDVVVQSSVDTYNASLLEAADPSNHVDFALFQPPINKDGPATREGPISGQANRLWLLERYRVTSRDYIEEDDDAMEANMLTEQTNVAVMSDKMTDTTVATDTIDIEIFEDKAPAMEFTELDHIAAQQVARVNAKHVWAIPQENIWRLLALVNLALFYARASSTSVAGFWHLVVFVNVGIHFCMSKLPSWENLLEFVQAVPRAPRMGKQKQIVKSETTAIATVHTSVSKVVVHSSTSAKTTLSYIPDAGSSTVHLKEPTEPPRNGKGEMFAGWCNVPGEILAVRSHGYKVSKQKVPSPGELYECVQVDIFESPQRYPDMATRVNLPKVTFQDDGPKTWRSPDIFIISIALPTDPPKMTKASSDGGGYTVTMYFRMKQATRDVLRRVTADDYDPSTETTDNIQKSTVNAVRLLEEWIRRAPTDHKFQSRFKVVPNAHNLKEIGMPSWIGSYNGKPFLIKRPGVTGFMFVHSELSCVELDVSLHPFPYLAKQGICFMKESYFKRVLVSFGFVIEGRTDDELPECLIGLMQLCYPDPQFAIQASDFFNGTAPRSF